MTRLSPEKDFFLAVLAAVITGKKPSPPPEGFDAPEFFRLAERHKLAGMVCDGIERFDLPLPAAVRNDFRREKKRDIVRDLVQRNETAKIYRKFEENGIPYLPLKGSRLRDDYPSPEMRTMLDVDILVPAESVRRVNQILTKDLGFQPYPQVRNVWPYKKPSALSLEIHEELFEPGQTVRYRDRIESLSAARLWPRLFLVEKGKQQREMTPDDFFIFMIVHLAHHFITEGIGVRFILDYHLFQRRYQISLTEGPAARILEEAGLSELTRCVDRVAETWFADAEPNDRLRSFEDFILSGGLLGKTENVFVNQISERTPSGVQGFGRLLFLIRSLFPPRRVMKDLYPVLRRSSIPGFVFPLFWIPLNLRRLSRFSFYWKKMSAVSKLESEKVSALENLYRQCGLGQNRNPSKNEKNNAS